MARSIFGDGYIDQTQENIDKGNPFGIYEHGNPILSWVNLMIHNIRVSFMMFVSGIFCGVPSLYLLAQKASCWAFSTSFLLAKGLGIDFCLVVFVHGTLEITALLFPVLPD